jgi:hypothetical protein
MLNTGNTPLARRRCPYRTSPEAPRPHEQTRAPGVGGAAPYLSLMAKKPVTREQAERKKTQAAAFMERIGESDRADGFDDTSVDDYAEHRGLQIANPTRKARKTKMAASGPSKTELQDTIDDAVEALNNAYTPEASREGLVAAVGEALDILNGEDDE